MKSKKIIAGMAFLAVICFVGLGAWRYYENVKKTETAVSQQETSVAESESAIEEPDKDEKLFVGFDFPAGAPYSSQGSDQTDSDTSNESADDPSAAAGNSATESALSSSQGTANNAASSTAEFSPEVSGNTVPEGTMGYGPPDAAGNPSPSSSSSSLSSSSSSDGTFRIPSTVFEFSPTYKMYATRHADGSDLSDVWMLASDTDKVQFYDLLDFFLDEGETVVRAPWSRDYYAQDATDPNTKESVNMLTAGSAYHVVTSNSKLYVTGVVHYWDVNFFEPGSPERAAAEADNQITQAYMDSVNGLLDSINDDNFGFYTNQIGGTTYGSKFRQWPDMNPEIFKGEEYISATGKTLSYTDPLEKYPKLQLTVNSEKGYVKNNKKITYSTVLGDYRLNGGWTVWDSEQAQGDTRWTDTELHRFIAGINIDSERRLKEVLVNDRGDSTDFLPSNGGWYNEDYEGIKVLVFQALIEIPAITSNPATLYEKLSDFRSDMNQWAPEMKHPIMQVDGTGARGYGDNVILKKNSVGAGTYIDFPGMTIYSGGINGGGQQLSNWTVVWKPYLFGVRGSVFD